MRKKRKKYQALYVPRATNFQTKNWNREMILLAASLCWRAFQKKKEINKKSVFDIEAFYVHSIHKQYCVYMMLPFPYIVSIPKEERKKVK